MFNWHYLRYTSLAFIPPSAQSKTISKIESFARLDNGWHYGRGIAADRSTIDRAISVFNQYIQIGFLRTDAFPGVDGEIMVTGYKDIFYVECTVAADGSYSVVGEQNNEVIAEAYGIGLSVATETITAVAKQTWTIFNSSIQNTMTIPKTNLKVWLSRTQTRTDAPRSYYADALMVPRAVTASISDDTIAPSE